MGYSSHRLTDDSQLFLSAPLCLFTPHENDPPPSRQRKKEKKSSNVCFQSSSPQLVVLCSISHLNHLVLLPERRKQTFSGSAKNPEQMVWRRSVEMSNSAFHFSFMFLKDGYLTSLFCSLSVKKPVLSQFCRHCWKSCKWKNLKCDEKMSLHIQRF